VLHTLNPRLHPDQLAYIANHAEDKVLCFDLTFLPPGRGGRVAPHQRQALHRHDRPGPHAGAEQDSRASAATRSWSRPRATPSPGPSSTRTRRSSLCYTSGTTGNPKGALYSHRSTVLHTFAIALPDALNLASRDVILPVVPMFHVNAWGLPYAPA
jgi:fatty-acyl-CoA synthase